MTDAFLHGDAAGRKQAPMAEGLLWYFPDALAAVANVSKRGNDQHNPGQPLHHARGKSTDHADCILRHLAHAGQRDSDGVRETAKVAWRALALLQEEIERDCGVPIPRNAKAQREWEHSTGELKSRDSTAGFTQPPNCSPGVSEPTPPMHAVALEMADAKIAKRTPIDLHDAYAHAVEYQTLVGN